MRNKLFFIVVLALLNSAAFAQGLRIQLANESARFMFFTEAFGQDFGRLELEAGYMYTEENVTNIQNEVANVGILVRGESLSAPLEVSIGFRGYIASVADIYDVGAITIGGDLRLKPDSWQGFGFGVNFHKAPSVVSYMDAEGFMEYGASLSFDITPQASMALGYQYMETTITGIGDVEIDKGIYFAVDLLF